MASVPAFATSGPITVTDPTTGQTAGLPGTAFQVTTGLYASPSRVWAGERMTVSGSALTATSAERLMLGTTFLMDVRTDRNGNFQVSVLVPWLTTPGRKHLSVSDTTVGTVIYALTILSSWPQLSATPARTADNAGETLRPPSKLPSLKRAFHVDFDNSTGGGAHSSPTVAGGLLYISAGSNLDAYDAITGAFVWTFATGGDVRSTPSVAAGIVYVTSSDSNLYALGASDGHFIWDFQAGAGIGGAPSISKGILYLGADDDFAYAVKASTGKLVWSYKTCNSASCAADEAPISVVSGVALVPSLDGFLYALDAATGSLLWYASAGTADGQGVAVANGQVYLANDYFVQALQLPPAECCGPIPATTRARLPMPTGSST